MTERPSSTTTAAVFTDTVGTGASATDTAAATAIADAAWFPWTSSGSGRAGPMRTDTALTGPTV